MALHLCGENGKIEVFSTTLNFRTVHYTNFPVVLQILACFYTVKYYNILHITGHFKLTYSL